MSKELSFEQWRQQLYKKLKPYSSDITVIPFDNDDVPNFLRELNEFI